MFNPVIQSSVQPPYWPTVSELVCINWTHKSSSCFVVRIMLNKSSVLNKLWSWMYLVTKRYSKVGGSQPPVLWVSSVQKSVQGYLSSGLRNRQQKEHVVRKLECPFKTPGYANVLLESPHLRLIYASSDFEGRNCLMGKLECPFKPYLCKCVSEKSAS